MRRLLYWGTHITITAATWALLHKALGVHWIVAAVLCGVLAAIDDGAVAGFASSLVRR
jgi:hypothetical protein